MTADVLLLRLDAPLVAFGGAAVDARGVVDPFPGRSLITGLLANALGWTHGEFERLRRLQGRLRLASRCDRPGEVLIDYQTVDLGQEHLSHGWTTLGRPESRGGGSSSGTHIRQRHYRADAVHTVAVALEPADEAPTVDALARALAAPARPLFIGRKCCLPSGPLLVGRARADSPIATLRALERLPSRRTGVSPEKWLEACWDAEEGAEVGPIDDRDCRLVPTTDTRDWANQIHTGRRLIWLGTINPPEASDEQ